MSIQSIKDFMPKELVNGIEEVMTHHQFPWYWRPSTTYGIYEEGKDSKDFQFVHVIYHEGKPYSHIFELAVDVLKCFATHTGKTVKRVDRIKANLTTPSTLTEADLDEAIHVDATEDKYWTLLYYVMDSDGDTILYDGEKVGYKQPRKGTAVLFPSNLKHRHTPPKLNKRRIVINFIFELE